MNADPKNWQTLEPHYTALLGEPLTERSISDWLRRWSDLDKLIWETRAGLKRARSWNQADEEAKQQFQRFLVDVFTPFEIITQALKLKLLQVTELVVASDEVQLLRRIQNEANHFREENVVLKTALAELESQYGQVVRQMTESGSQGEPGEPSSAKAQWKSKHERWLQGRDALDTLFLTLRSQRQQLARNANFDNYCSYRWHELGRFDYTPADARAFHQAVAEEIVPLITLWHERQRRKHGGAARRPWEREPGEKPLARSFESATDFETAMVQVFRTMDAELGTLFERMRQGFLDIGSREGKTPGSEEWLFPVTGLPYVRLASSETDVDVFLLLHECGHAFHDFLSLQHQGLIWNTGGPSEFGEFAAICMTYLAQPYLRQERGGFYTDQDAQRMMMYTFNEPLRWIPHIALVDSFQHWVYTEAAEDVSPAELDAKWLELAAKFEPNVDWSGLEKERAFGWQQESLIFEDPFYIIEYGLAHLGALQVWQKALADYPGTWKAYRDALSLGNTLSLPELYRAVGATLPFERNVIREVAHFLESVLDG